MTNGAKRILVVDDEAVIRRLLTRLLAGPQYDVTFAESVRDGLSKIEAASADFDLLISDLRMPDGSGASVIRGFKTKSPLGGVIVITGSLTPENSLRDIKNEEINACLTKPFALDDLKSSVNRVLGFMGESK